MKKLLIILLFIIYILSPTHGRCNSITSATVSYGEITIVGEGFGVNALDQSNLSSNIEAGTVDSEISLPSGWVSDVTTTARQRPHYSATEAHSGGKSIKSFFPLESVYTSGFWNVKDAGFSSAYATWWFKPEPLTWRESATSATIGQFKMFRITPGEAGGPYEDQAHNWSWFQQLKGTSIPPNFEDGSKMFVNYCLSDSTPEYDNSCYAGELPGAGIYRDYSPKNNVWQRIEVWTEQSSPAGLDGTVHVLIHRSEDAVPVTPVPFVDYLGATCTRETDTLPWKMVVWENFYGSGVDQGEFYFDDVHVQYGTPARIEMGNAPVFANCTHREIQPAATWSDTGITGTLNIGSFAPNATVYFFVVDADGVASAGKLVNLSGTPTYDPPTITGPDDFSTTSSSAEIEGAYGVDPDLADQSVVVTWTLGEDSGFAVAALGVFSCTVPVELGTNNIVFRVVDSNDGEDSDTTVVTRTANVIYTGSMSGGTYR